MKSSRFFVLAQTFYLIMKIVFLFSCKQGIPLEEEQTLIDNAEKEAVETQRVLQEMAEESKNLVQVFKLKGPMAPELFSSLQKVKELAILASESSQKVVKNVKNVQIESKSTKDSKLVLQKILKLLEKVEAAEKAVETLKDINIKKISEEKKNDDLDTLFEAVMLAYNIVKKLMIYTQDAANILVTNILISN